ncbi:MAG: FAD-dependent oxidoreductase [Geminicoccaceae bacterium]|nr:FAD-dependent oxidoreductase [Geminicoccaceae bacterium]
MGQAFPHLFRPLDIRGTTLRNRITFGAHTANMAEDGLPGARHLGYYLERAKGGAGMIVVEPVPVMPEAVLTRGNFRVDDDALIAPMRRITEACRAEGAVMIQQLYHVGQHGDWDNAFEAARSPSGLPSYHDGDGSHGMDEGEIEAAVEGFVRAAVRAKACGFQGVELFAAYHALIDQFWTPWSNRRDDRWGGDLEGRCRFSAEIMRRVREACGDGFIVGLAVSCDANASVALSLESLCEVVAWHDARALMDYVTCGTGSYFDFAPLIPTVLYAEKLGVPAAEALKGVCRHAKVQAESHIRTPENAEDVIRTGGADLVSIVRGQIADPHLANKAGAGEPETIRPCISCNQMCWGRRYRDYWISCTINPSAGREWAWGGDRFARTDAPKRVLVVGGGVAGMECARVAATRGHGVVLAEAAPELGGQMRLAGEQPRRGQILDLLAWYENELARLQVEVRRNTPVDAEDVAGFGADAVVVATGSEPEGEGFQRALPQFDALPGVEKGNVLTVHDVMRRAGAPGRRVLLLDDIGHWQGPGTAWKLAEAGHEVTIVTPHPMVGHALQRTAADGPLRARLAALGVRLVVEAAVAEWRGNAAVLQDLRTGERRDEPFDTLVLATVTRSQDGLKDGMPEEGPPVHVIGDALAPRLAQMAIFEGRRLGRAL